MLMLGRGAFFLLLKQPFAQEAADTETHEGIGYEAPLEPGFARHARRDQGTNALVVRWYSRYSCDLVLLLLTHSRETGTG